MPVLKDLNCSIELSDSQRTLQEFGTTYGDGYVETFVGVPHKPQSFSVHLKSDRFIAPGVAMYIYIDGVYQCNRNRQDLKLRKAMDSRSVVDFKVRQKEEKQKDGSMIAREWRFEKLNASADGAPDKCSSNILDNIGCIEVLVLRCAGSRNVKTAAAINMDGANDYKDHHEYVRSAYDDRIPRSNHLRRDSRPPPPISYPTYRAPYAETERSQDPSRFENKWGGDRDKFSSSSTHKPHYVHPHSLHSAPHMPTERPTSTIPSDGFWYGSGPIPPGPIIGSEKSFYHTRPHSAVAPHAQGVDPAWLDEMLTKAVKRGVEEARHNEVPVAEPKDQSDFQSHIPGAWPQSPFTAGATPSDPGWQAPAEVKNQESDQETSWGTSDDGWGQKRSRSQSRTRVAWDEDDKWDSKSRADGWETSEDIPTDSWDTEETWASDKPKMQAEHARHTTTSKSKPSSKVEASPHESRPSRDQRSRRSRSKSRTRTRYSSPMRKTKVISSSDDESAWTHVRQRSSSRSSSVDSDDTLQPSHSRSQLHASKSQSRSHKSSHKSKSGLSRDKKSSRNVNSTVKEEPKSRFTTVPASPPWPKSTHSVHKPHHTHSPTHERKYKTASHPRSTRPASWEPGWGSDVPEKPQKHTSTAHIVPPLFPAPQPYMFTEGPQKARHLPWGVDPNSGFGDSKNTQRSSWGSDEKDKEADSSWGVGDDDDGWKGTADDGWKDTTDGGWKDTAADHAWKDTADDVWETKPGDSTDEVGWGNDKIEDDGWGEKNTGWSPDHKTAAKDTETWASNNDSWNTKAKNNNSRATNDAPPEEKGTPRPSTNPTPSKPAPPSKRHTTKSLSKYRPHRPPSSPTGPKPHWQFPPPAPANPPTSLSATTILPPEPLYAISRKTASELGVEHQVRAGAGSAYGHMVGRPEYVDTLDKPYAVFRFKYRSRDVLRGMFGAEVAERGRLSARMPGAEWKEMLGRMEKGELVERMVGLQGRLAEKEKEKEKCGGEQRKREKRTESRSTESVARDLTTSWVMRQSGEGSVKGQGRGRSERKERKKGGDEGWRKDLWN